MAAFTQLVGALAGVVTKLQADDTLTLDLDALTFDDTTDGTPVLFNQGLDIATGKLLAFNGTSTPAAEGDVGFNFSSGRLTYHDGSTVQTVAHSGDIGTPDSGTYAARAGTPALGDVYFVSDRPGLVLWCLAAGTWTGIYQSIEAWSGSFPGLSLTTWTNQGGSSYSEASGAGVLTYAASGGGISLRVRHKAHTGPGDLAILHSAQSTSNDMLQGIALRESSTGKLIVMYADATLSVRYYNSPTSFNSTPLPGGQPRWPIRGLSVEDDNTDLTFRYSFDGDGDPFADWQTLGSPLSRTAFTLTGPNQIGLFGDSEDATDDGKMVVWGVEEN